MICIKKLDFIYFAKSDSPESPVMRCHYDKTFFKETVFKMKDFTGYEIIEFPKELRAKAIIGYFNNAAEFLKEYL